ncbi:GMC oxidoreductase [Ganoderma leucocontextum]|nr:GMC oxidoreductase [Ganoderma leucocontextum]
MGLSASKFITDPSVFATSHAPGPSNLVTDDERAHWKSFDYVIVGGGTAGCVLASRLSEDPSITVLLIEAGASHEDHVFTRIPMAFRNLLQSSADWQFWSSPQDDVDGRKLYWPKGKILGGTRFLGSISCVIRDTHEIRSSLNALIYHTGDPADYDAWEQQGATGWGYTTMRRYFDKISRDGPRINKSPLVAPISEDVIEAARNIGIPTSTNFNTSEGSLGAGLFHAMMDGKNERSSTATAYLNADVLARPNLKVAVKCTTERVVFTQETGGLPTAAGVLFSQSRDGPKFVVGARREVILSAGIVGSPQILQLSGVGPANDLKKFQIPVVHDLPSVGQNLLDHFTPGVICFRAKPGKTLDNLVQSPLRGALAALQWLMFGTGPMASLAGQVGIFTRSDDETVPYGPHLETLPIKNFTSGPRSPDLEIILFPLAVTKLGMGVAPAGNYGVSLGPVILKPASRGYITLRSADPYDHPIIDPRYLSDESDINLIVRSMRLTMNIARTTPLVDHLDLRSRSGPDGPDDIFWPGDADPNTVSDDELKRILRMRSISCLHPTSTARMGTDPSNSVVDLELRVHGVRGLRVCDASVFPDQVSGHPAIPVIAVAERAADIIKGSQ